MHKIYGRVKTVRTEYFDVIQKEGKLVPGSHVGDNITMDSVDEKGNLLVSQVFAVGGGLRKSEKFIYNPKGKIIAIEAINGSGVVSSSQDLYYDEKGRKIKQVVHMHLPDGIETYWRTWAFDSIGQMVESLVYRSDTTLDSREVLTYYEQDSGKIYTHSLFVGYDSLKYRNQYEYSKAGFDSIIHRYRPIGNTDSIGYQSRYEYTFDERGEEVTRNLVSPEGQIRAKVLYTYEYDDHNNWIRRLETVDDEPSVFKVRTYTYYE